MGLTAWHSDPTVVDIPSRQCQRSLGLRQRRQQGSHYRIRGNDLVIAITNMHITEPVSTSKRSDRSRIWLVRPNGEKGTRLRIEICQWHRSFTRPDQLYVADYDSLIYSYMVQPTAPSGTSSVSSGCTKRIRKIPPEPMVCGSIGLEMSGWPLEWVSRFAIRLAGPVILRTPNGRSPISVSRGRISTRFTPLAATRYTRKGQVDRRPVGNNRHSC